MESKTKVIFRKFADGEIIALFPELAGNSDPNTCTSYMHIGQHDSVSLQYVIDTTKIAECQEFHSLQKELTGIGYNLEIIRKNNRKYYETRLNQLKHDC